MLGALVAHRADQPRAAGAGQWKYRQEISLLEVNVELAIDRGAARLDIRDVEQLTVGAARISGPHCLTHNRVDSIAPCDIICLAHFLAAVRSPQPRGNTIALFPVADQLGLALDR